MLRFLVYATFILFSVSSYSIQYLGYKLKNDSLLIHTDQQVIQVRPLSKHALEIHYLTDNGFPSFAIDPELDSSSLKSNFTESEYALVFELNSLSMVLNKQALTMSFFNQGKLLTRHHIKAFEKPKVNFSFDLTQQEKLMGAGERVLGMDRRGHKLPLYNRAHYGYTTYSEQMNFSLPAIMSNKKYVLLFDNSAKGWLDLGKTQHDSLAFTAAGGRASFIIAAADTYPELIQEYVEVTGKQPMPARWFLDNHASRFGYKSQQEVLSTIKLYRELDIPVDSIILDLYWFGKDVQGHMGHLTWDRDMFPEPVEMIKQLKEMNVKTTLITEPFVLKQAKRHDEALAAEALSLNSAGTAVKYYDFYFGHTALVDVFSDNGKAWFSNVYRELADQGVTGVWGDLGEPEVHPEDMQHELSKFGITATADEVHNVYGHQWANVVKDAIDEALPNTRPFILMRAGFVGSQRFGLIPWTGDVSRSWDGLKPQVELSLQMGLLGLAYTHSDLGGFAGDNYDKEMYIRWLQYGVFQPIYRPHAQDKVPSEPVYHDSETQDILREYIKLRYSLIPYNYTLAYENALTGMPLMRPMFFSDESDPDLIEVKDQFMWGHDFLVKPVTTAGVSSVKVNLPQGNWFNYWTGEHYKGGKNINFPVDLTKIPVLVRAGAIIPSVEAVASLDNYTSENLNLDFYFDPSVPLSSARVFEDDGRSADSIENKKYEVLTFEFKNKKKLNQLELTFKRDVQGDYVGMPKNREINLTIHNLKSTVASLQLGKKQIEIYDSKEALASKKQGAYYDVLSQKFKLKFQWFEETTLLILQF